MENKKANVTKIKQKQKLTKLKLLLSTSILVIVAIYIITSIINLVRNPSSTFILRNGKISKEETENVCGKDKIIKTVWNKLFMKAVE